MKKTIITLLSLCALVTGVESFASNAQPQSVLLCSASSSSAQQNWDKILDEYESYVDQYITMLKKSKAGDMTAMTEAASLMSKANSLSNQLNNAKDSMTTAQMTRLMQIATKMSSAAMSL